MGTPWKRACDVDMLRVWCARGGSCRNGCDSAWRDAARIWLWACVARRNFRGSAGACDACWTGLNSALEVAVFNCDGLWWAWVARCNARCSAGAGDVSWAGLTLICEGWLWASAVGCNVCGSAGANGVAWSGRMASTIHLAIIVTEAGWCGRTVVMNSCVASPRSCLVLAM